MGVTSSGDLLYLIAMMKTTPLIASVGQSLTMPLAVIGDFILHGTVSFIAILGCIVVLVSFVVLGLEDSKNEAKNEVLHEGLSEESLRDESEEEVEMGIDVHRLD